MMRKRGLITAAIIILAAGILSACGKQNATTDNKQNEQVTSSQDAASGEKVTLKVLRAGITVTEYEFEKTLVEATKKAFPNVQLEWVEAPEDVDLEALITSGEVPDLIFVATSNLATTIADLQLAENLLPYVEKYDVDLSRLK